MLASQIELLFIPEDPQEAESVTIQESKSGFQESEQNTKKRSSKTLLFQNSTDIERFEIPFQDCCTSARPLKAAEKSEMLVQGVLKNKSKYKHNVAKCLLSLDVQPVNATDGGITWSEMYILFCFHTRVQHQTNNATSAKTSKVNILEFQPMVNRSCQRVFIDDELVHFGVVAEVDGFVVVLLEFLVFEVAFVDQRGLFFSVL